MSAKQKTLTSHSRNETYPSGFTHVASHNSISEFCFRKNGLRVLIVRLEGSPTITTNIVYHVGSQHERRGETGLSHMLEHMLFKETTGKGPTWKHLENLGALMNATTWLDRTVYFFTLPKEYLGMMLEVEADRMKNVKLTEKEFTPERTNVLSEYEMYYSRPEMVLEWEIAACAFKYHGYHHDTIGFKSDIQSYTVDKLRRYYHTHYHPSNATLIVAGDVPTAAILKEIKRTFGHIPNTTRHDSEFEPLPEPPQEGMRRIVLERDTPIREVSFAFRVPPFSERSWTALQLAFNHLTDGDTSVLYKALVEKKLATSVSGSIYPTKDPYLGFITVRATERTPYEKIEDVVWSALDDLSRTRIPQSTVRLLQSDLYAHDLFSRDGSHDVAVQLGEYVATGSWKRYFDHLEEIESITGSEIQKAVREYLLPRNVTIGTLGTH